MNRKKHTEIPPSKVAWPSGPQYWETTNAAPPVRAWVLYKLASADWYLDRLETLFATLPKVEHQVGVEMALDGALQALCSAVDAAAGGVIQAIERHAGVKPPTEPHEYTLPKTVALLRNNHAPKSARALSVSRKGYKSDATGWLAQLQHVRNEAVHRSTLPRTHYYGGDLHGQVHLDIPGLGTREPAPYLRDMRAKVEQLAEKLLAEVDRFAPGDQEIGAPKRSVNLTLDHSVVSQTHLPR